MLWITPIVSRKKKQRDIAKQLDRIKATPSFQPPAKTIQLKEQHFRGPIPDPDSLARYDEIEAGLASRLVKMAEDESVHRRSLEVKHMDAQIHDLDAIRSEARLGQVFALAIGLVAIGCGTYAAVNDSAWAGGFIGTGGVIGLVTVFIKGRSQPPSPPEDKSKSDG